MTDEEAIELMRSIRRTPANWILEYEAIDKAIEALEKQIPKKLINFSCPVCSRYFEDGDTRNYCPNCGQRLE